MQTQLAKGAIETVPSANRESGFYSRYFLVHEKDGGMRPILNRLLMLWPFKYYEIDPNTHLPWGLVFDSGPERCLLGSCQNDP